MLFCPIIQLRLGLEPTRGILCLLQSSRHVSWRMGFRCLTNSRQGMVPLVWLNINHFCRFFFPQQNVADRARISCLFGKVRYDFCVQIFVSQILVTSVNTRIIVHFNHDVFTVHFFDVDAIKSFTDDTASFQRCFP